MYNVFLNPFRALSGTRSFSFASYLHVGFLLRLSSFLEDTAVGGRNRDSCNKRMNVLRWRSQPIDIIYSGACFGDFFANFFSQ